MVKIVFFGSSEIALETLDILTKKHEVVALVSNPDSIINRKKELHITPTKQYALEHKIPVLTPQKFTLDVIKNLETFKADIFVIFSYGKIIPLSVIDIPRYKTINIHTSLLPLYRGASPIQSALLHGDKKTGNTIQLINEKMDQGDILLQESFPIEETDDYLSLEKKASSNAKDLVLKVLDQFEKNTITRTPQDHKKATYCKMIKKEDGFVDFKKDSAFTIQNKWKAYKKWPGIYTYFTLKNGKKVKLQLLSIKATNKKDATTLGCVCEVTKKCEIKCLENTSIHLLEVQIAGKKAMDIKNFLNGYQISVGQDFTGELDD